MRAAVVGAGAVGARAARQLAATPGVAPVIIRDPDDSRRLQLARILGSDAALEPGGPQATDVEILAGPCGTHRELAWSALDRGAHVVSVSDSIADVTALLDLDAEARERGLRVVVGAGFSPGLSCLLARIGARRVDTVDEVIVARFGTGGPACARQRHRALQGRSLDWRAGAWLRRPSGSGRELHFFPEPVGGADCYRASLPDPVLLRRAFPTAHRISARMAATRRDRLTSLLPMLRPPHPEGLIGASRVEIRGRTDGEVGGVILGVVDRPAAAAGAVAAVVAQAVATGQGGAPGGAAGLAEWTDPGWVLRDLHTRGIKAARFVGLGDLPGP